MDYTSIIVAILGIGGTIGGHWLGVKKERVKWEEEKKKELLERREKLINNYRKLRSHNIHGDNPNWIVTKPEYVAIISHFDELPISELMSDPHRWHSDIEVKITKLAVKWGIV